MTATPTVKDLLDDVAARATTGRSLDPSAALARAATRRVGRRRRVTALACGVAAGGLVSVWVGTRRGRLVGTDLAGVAPTGSPAAPWHGPADGLAALAAAPGVLTALAVVVAALGTLTVLAVANRTTGQTPLRRRLVVAALAVLAAALVALPSAVGTQFSTWTLQPPRFITGVPQPASYAGSATVLPNEVRDQRLVPPRAFDEFGRPRTTRVTAVFRASLAGRIGTYALDAASGGTVRLDDLPLIAGDGLTPPEELAVSPNGRFVVSALPGDDRHTGTGAGATIVDLQKARVGSVPLLAPPGSSSGGVTGPSLTLAVLDDGTLVVVRDANRSLWVYPASGGRRELTAYGAVTGVAALPGDRFLVWRGNPADAEAVPPGSAGPALDAVQATERIDMVRASTGSVMAFTAFSSALFPDGRPAGLVVADDTSLLVGVGGGGDPGVKSLPLTGVAGQVLGGAGDRPYYVLRSTRDTEADGTQRVDGKQRVDGMQRITVENAAPGASATVLTTFRVPLSGLVVASDGLTRPSSGQRVEPWWTALGAGLGTGLGAALWYVLGGVALAVAATVLLRDAGRRRL